MFGPVATSLPLTPILKPMTSTGSHFHPRLTCLVNLICQIHSPQSRRPCPGREFCGTSKAQGLLAKKTSLVGPRCRATYRPQATPSRQLCFRPVPVALVSLFFLAGSGMTLEVELMWLQNFANSIPGACLSSCIPRPLPLGF